MSSYLERLVDGALRPSESIRPMVGSVFSPVSRVGEGATQLGEDVSASDGFEQRSESHARSSKPTAADNDSAPKAPSQASVASSPPLVTSGKPAHEAGQQREQRHTQAPIRRELFAGPHSAERIAEPAEAPSSRDSNSSSASKLSPAPPLQPEPLLSGTFAGQPASEAPPAKRRDFTPLVPIKDDHRDRDSFRRTHDAEPGLAERHGPAKTAAHALIPGSSSRIGRQDAPRPAQQPTREPDEIHIHIGRIEVTAALPASRPVPAPIRKGPSLAEYLKRSPGRHP